MTDTSTQPYSAYLLPPNVVYKADVAHLVSELERVDNDYTAKAARQKIETPPSSADDQSPLRLSDQLTAFLDLNQLTLDDSHRRSELITQLRLLKNAVPVLHMTFAVTVEPEELLRLTDWVRRSLHPQAVIEIGLQPGLVAGMYLRTPNKVHDFSLRSQLKAHHNDLTQQLEALRVGK